MDRSDRTQVVLQALEACTRGDAQVLADLFTDDVVAWSPLLLVESLEELIAAMDDVDSALSDVSVSVGVVDVVGDKGFAEYRIAGRFTGPFEADDAIVPPNGRELLIGGALVVEFRGDKIAKFRNYFDELTLLEQMLEPA